MMWELSGCVKSSPEHFQRFSVDLKSGVVFWLVSHASRTTFSQFEPDESWLCHLGICSCHQGTNTLLMENLNSSDHKFLFFLFLQSPIFMPLSKLNPVGFLRSDLYVLHETLPQFHKKFKWSLITIIQDFSETTFHSWCSWSNTIFPGCVGEISPNFQSSSHPQCDPYRKRVISFLRSSNVVV